MAIKYLYLDDDPERKVGQIARSLSIEGKLEVTYQSVSFFKPQIEQLLAPDWGFDGLLLDLRLDQEPREDGQKAEYTATTLAQFLRTKVYDQEAGIRDFPIVLCSQQSKIGMYEADISSHDLFDYKFPKEDVEVRAEEISSNMVALVEGYRTIAAAGGNWSTLLAYDTAQLDTRIFSRFTNRSTAVATHEYARHILKELLAPTSELIKETILAARLGLATTADGWPRLRDEVFGAARYKGAFGQSWERWWQPEVNRIFESLCSIPLPSLDAAERVAALVEHTGLTGLMAAEPIKLNHSTWYWTICEAYKVPLDPAEGFRLAGVEPTVWQEYDYISLHALLEQLHATELHRPLHPDETPRFEAIRGNYA
jgi:hypothetical protein